MNIMMYVITVLLLLLCIEPVRESIYSFKKGLNGVMDHWRRMHARREKGMKSVYASIFFKDAWHLRSKINGIRISIMTGFCYGVGFCLAVWWLFPWLYQ